MLYFAYGSNLHHFQMKRRCKDSIFLKKINLKDFRLTFRSKYRAADIEPKKNSIVPGALFEISKSDEKLEKDQQTLDNSISNTLSSIFRPEFLNRIDEVVKFNPLSIDELQKIIILQTEDLKNLLLEQKINIAIDKKVINKIANDSYEPEYGARPLSRELRRQIENPLAAKLLEDNFKNKKNITIKLNPAKKDEIVFKPS